MSRTKQKLDTIKFPRRASIPKIEAPHILGRGPKHLQGALMAEVRSDAPGEVPPGIVATKPEWYCYWALLRLGKKPGLDFDFQSSLMGGRLELGGAVVDFLFLDPPNLAINIQGLYWHYAFGGDRKAHDRMMRQSLENRGIRVVYIDEDHVIRAPLYYVSEALKGIDHSRMAT